MSAPFNGAIGNIVSKGFDVISKNNKKPTRIKILFQLFLILIFVHFYSDIKNKSP
jgi:predicted nucleic acid-binding Zn ribbon protein